MTDSPAPAAGPLVIAPPVAAALAAGRAVVALETSILAQGLPWPHNLEAGLAAEAAVIEAGAVPATIGLLDGTVRIGLDRAQLGHFARNEGRRIAKAATRDLPLVAARGGDAATTVSATLFCAARAGIAVAATGGIGGVHRGAVESFDISADLAELARTPIVLACAGAKSILDLRRTLEALETLGVTTVGYGTGEWPAFYCRESGLPLSAQVDDAAQAAALARAHRALGLPGALLVAVPPPAASALAPGEVEDWTATAAAQATGAGVAGPAVTPWLLARVRELSGGRVLAANLALYRNNAGVAAAIAVALAAA